MAKAATKTAPLARPIKASVFLTPEMNRALKVRADEESQKSGERVSMSTLAGRILKKALGL